LEQCAREAADEIGRLRAELEAAKAEITRLNAGVALIVKWQAEGEKLLEGKGGLMFSLGAWWADRPWRTDRNDTEALDAYVEQYKTDAERYRWLVENCDIGGRFNEVYRAWDGFSPFDEAIDRARGEK
jgi:hypothetical protein